MKKIVLFVIFYFTLINISNAQLKNESLDQSKNYLNSRITFLMLDEFIKSDKKNKSNFEAIKPFFENLTVDNAKNFNVLNEILKSNFKITVKNLSDPINTIRTDILITLSKEEAAKRITDSSLAILNRGYPEIFKSIIKNKDTLVSAINVYLGKTNPTISVDKKTSLNTPDIQSPSVKENSPVTIPNNVANTPGFFSFSHFSFWSLLPLLVCLVFMFLLKNVVLKLGDRIERRKQEIEKLKSSKPVENFQYMNTQSDPSDLEKRLINSDAIQKLSWEIEELKKNLVTKKSDNVNFFPEVPQYSKNPIPTNETFYMAGPVNNYFPNTAKSNTKENTVYKFTVKPNNQEANYEIHTLGAPINEILSMAESYIKTACDEENIPSGNVSNIITKKQGSAILEGDKWIIKTKAIIRYE
jgi:hypothetical protein